jgi:nucleotide-binding universal stress UspA family protein
MVVTDSVGASTGERETTVGKWRTIVVGVDGSPGSRTALTWAAAEAADHGADLVVLNVWEHTLLPPAGSVSVSERYVPDPSQRTADDLVNVIKETLGEEPPVLVQPRVKQGRPAKVLIEESTNADLLVVGKRGHGGFAGLVLGSVSQHVAAYAECPVTVVR